MATLEYNVKPIGTSAGLCHVRTEEHALMELRATIARAPTVSQVNLINISIDLYPLRYLIEIRKPYKKITGMLSYFLLFTLTHLNIETILVTNYLKVQ